MQSANLSIETATATDIIPTPSQSILYVLDFDEENPGLSTPYDVITDNNDLYISDIPFIVIMQKKVSFIVFLFAIMK